MWVEILILFILLCLWFYHYCTKQFGEFKKRGIPFAKPSFPFGSSNAKKVLMGETSFFEVDRMLAENEFKNEKVFGYFMMGQPTVVINDEELAKCVLVKDFDHFTDLRPQGYKADTKDSQIIMNQLGNLKGERWKKVRSVMTNVFSSGKLKGMTPHILKCGEQLMDYMDPIVEKGEEIDARNIASLFTLDAMATSGYGLELNSFENPDNVFRKMVLTLVGAPGYGSHMDMVRMIFIMTAPSLAKMLKVPHLPRKPAIFFADVIERTYRHRKDTGEKRNDIINVIIEEMKSDEMSKIFKEEEKEIILVAQAILLFVVGFDSAAIGLSIVIHHLVKNQEIQDELLAEVDNVLEEAGGQVTYEGLQELKYLDRVIMETGRYKQLQTSHERMCTKDYNIPGTNIIIPKGRMVHVYFTPIENDKKNFVNPEKFDPNNWLPENNPNKFGYMFFGQGPRACPAQRYATLKMKIFLVHLLKNHRLVASPKSNKGDLELDPNDGLFSIKGGVWFKMEKRI